MSDRRPPNHAPRCVTVMLVLLSSTAALSANPVVRSRSDLPATRFSLDEAGSRAFLGEHFLDEVVPALFEEANGIATRARIEDEAIDQQLTSGLVAIDLLKGRAAEAERRIHALRRRMSNPQMRAVGLLAFEAIAAGMQAPTPDRCTAAAARVRSRLERADAKIVRDAVLQQHNINETASPGFYAGVLRGFVDDEIAQQKSVGLFSGLIMAHMRVSALHVPVCRDEVGASLRAWLAAPANAVIDIWSGREPPANAFEAAKPVVVAIWDTGIDTNLFAGRMAIDPAEPLDGRDNDGNGVIDDVHGPTWDYRVRPTAHPLALPSDFLAPRLAYYMAIDKGERDLGYGYDTPEARFYARRAREASAEEQADDLIANAENQHRHHGTFVASQVAEGADFIRIYNVRLLPAGYDPKPIPVSEAEFDRFADAIAVSVDRMKRAGVRIANMSWWFRVDSIAERMLQQGVERDPAKARSRARKIHATLEDTLARAIAGAPEILFVPIAGNSSQSAETAQTLPAGIDLPNVIVVGASGQSGVPTRFTTFGEGVDIYARGEGSRGRMPGGMIDHRSGTSMAAPMVSRAAAQMLAVNPRLSPPDLVEGLLATATEGDPSMKLLDAAAAVQWARAQR